jgi:hypothetical protein
MPEADATFLQIARQHLKGNLVASQDADSMLPHLAGGISQYARTVGQGHAKLRIR